MDLPEVLFHTQFQQPQSNRDTVLTSSDGVFYCVPSFILRNTTSLFKKLLQSPSAASLSTSSTFTDPHAAPIPISAHSDVLTPVLLMLSGLPAHENAAGRFQRFSELEGALSLLEIWGAPGPIQTLRASIMSYLSMYDLNHASPPVAASAGAGQQQPQDTAEKGEDEEPKDKISTALRLYALATRLGWDDAAQQLEQIVVVSLGVSVWSARHERELVRLGPEPLMKLVLLVRVRRYEFGRLWAEKAAAMEAASEQKHHEAKEEQVETKEETDDEQTEKHKAEDQIQQHMPGKRCRRCSNSDVLADLRAKAYWEIDRHPSGDTILDAIELDDWKESMECWGVNKCHFCGRDRLERKELLRQVRQVLDALPRTLALA